jgi:hypothetical protein
VLLLSTPGELLSHGHSGPEGVGDNSVILTWTQAPTLPLIICHKLGQLIGPYFPLSVTRVTREPY